MNQYWNQSAFNPYEYNMQTVKNYFKRPLMLFWGIIKIVSIVLSTVVSAVYGTTIVSRMMEEYYRNVPGNNIFQGTKTTVEIPSIPVIAVLTIVAILIIYFKSKNPSPQSNPKSGFTMNWVIAIIGLVGNILALAVMLLALFVLFFAFMGSYNEDAVYALLIVVPIITLIAGIGLFSTVNNVRYWSSVRKSAGGLELTAKGASPYAVMCIITGTFSALVSVGLMILAISGSMYAITGFTYYTISLPFIVLSVISSVVSVVDVFTDGIIAFGYAGYIKKIKSGGGEFTNRTNYAYAPNEPIGYTYNPANAQNQGMNNPYETQNQGANHNMQPSAESLDNAQSQAEQSSQTQNQVYEAQDVRMDTSGINPGENPFAQTNPYAQADSGFGEGQPETQSAPYVQQAQAQTENGASPAFCPTCGAPVGEDFVFCNNCGRRIR